MQIDTYQEIHGIEIHVLGSYIPGSMDPDYIEDELTIYDIDINGMEGEAFLKSWTMRSPDTGLQTNALDHLYCKVLNSL